MEPNIAICGNDQILLLTRVMVLASAGLEAEAVLGLGSLQQLIHQESVLLTILCHSLLEEEKEGALRYISQAMPNSKSLLLTVGDRKVPERATLSLDAFEGPVELIAVVHELLV